jgi:3-oxoacyl-[acyl-carrier-protein] synthase III
MALKTMALNTRAGSTISLSTMARTVIKDCVHVLPQARVSNDQLAQIIDTSDKWIQERTGIGARYWARLSESGPRSNTELAKAALDLLCSRNQGLESSFDTLIVATISPDDELVGCAQSLLSIPGARPDLTVLEIRNYCSGYLYALKLACALIESGSSNRIIILAGELQSTGLLVADEGRDTAVLFGDGYSASLIERGEQEAGVVDIQLGADGAGADKLGVQVPGFAFEPFLQESDLSVESRRAFPIMDGRTVFKAATSTMADAIRQLLADTGVSLSEIDHIIPHQANQRIVDYLANALGEQDKFRSNISEVGNTTAGSIPILLSMLLENNQIKQGDLILLVAFGAGFSWGACLVRW